MTKAIAIAAAICFGAASTAQGVDMMATITDLSESERNKMFATIVDSSEDHSCQTVTHSLVRGDVEGEVFVTVRCDDGTDYGLRLAENRSGVMTCAMLESVTDLDCWHPLD